MTEFGKALGQPRIQPFPQLRLNKLDQRHHLSFANLDDRPERRILGQLLEGNSTMFTNTIQSVRRGLGLALGIAAVGALGAIPAAASSVTAADCAAQSGTVTVRAVAISQGQTITLQQVPDMTYQGDGQIEVFCKAGNGTNLGDIPDAQVKVSVLPTGGVPGVTASMFTITGTAVATPGNPVFVGPVSGLSAFTITAPATLLPPGVVSADVGVQFEIVTLAYGAPLTDPSTGYVLKPGTFGDVLAATPELDSLALFGTGALGLVGYALMRRRAARRS